MANEPGTCIICGNPTTPRGKTCSNRCKGIARSAMLEAKREAALRESALRETKCRLNETQCAHYAQCLDGSSTFTPRNPDWSCYETPGDSNRPVLSSGASARVTLYSIYDRSRYNRMANYVG